jgi:hypothetical protein
VGLRPLACWDCGFESRQRHECLPVVSVVRFQVGVSAPGLSLVQRSPTKCGVPNECDREAQSGEAMTRNCVETPRMGGGSRKEVSY